MFGFLERFEPIAPRAVRRVRAAALAPAGWCCAQQHHANAGEQADPCSHRCRPRGLPVATQGPTRRVGYGVDELGIAYSSPARQRYGAVLCLRDPDDFQLELSLALEHHPSEEQPCPATSIVP
ncbi:hypothetical protein HBB16_15030 [Pseudonocardia sp. MCCB 268]|nr:hypothetical protein [Pseudonocardia cytotoxica]